MENLWGIPESRLPDPLWLKRRPACRQSHPRISGAEIMFRLLKQGKNKLTFLLDRLSQIKEDENGHVCFFYLEEAPHFFASKLWWKTEDIGSFKTQMTAWSSVCRLDLSRLAQINHVCSHRLSSLEYLCFCFGFFHVKCSLSQWTLKKKFELYFPY